MKKININNYPPKKTNKKISDFHFLQKNDNLSLSNASKMILSNQDSFKNSSKIWINSNNKKLFFNNKKIY